MKDDVSTEAHVEVVFCQLAVSEMKTPKRIFVRGSNS
jgi:predicted RNase H-like nuclease